MKKKGIGAKYYTMLATSLIVFIGVIGLLWLGAGESEASKKKEFNKAHQEYREYLDENEIITFIFDDALIATYGFYKNMNYDKSPQAEMEDRLEWEMNNYISEILDSSLTTESDIDKIAHIVDEIFISEKNKANHREIKALFNRYNNDVASKTDEEMEAIEHAIDNYIKIDMLASEVEKKLGKPNDKIRSTSKNNFILYENEIWSYDNKLVYLNDGVVYKIIDL